MIEVADRLHSVEEYYFSRKLKEVNALIASGKPVINLGIGSRYQLSDNLFGMGEAKYAVNNGGYMQVSVGVLYQL